MLHIVDTGNEYEHFSRFMFRLTCAFTQSVQLGLLLSWQVTFPSMSSDATKRESLCSQRYCVVMLSYVYSKQLIFGLTQEWFRELSFSRLDCGVHDKLRISSADWWDLLLPLAYSICKTTHNCYIKGALN